MGKGHSSPMGKRGLGRKQMDDDPPCFDANRSRTTQAKGATDPGSKEIDREASLATRITSALEMILEAMIPRLRIGEEQGLEGRRDRPAS